MSLCDTCKAPGHCCKSIYLFGNDLDDRNLSEADAAEILTLYGQYEADEDGNEFPFVIVGPSPEYGGQLRLTCPKLGQDGRCTIYDRRPMLCRDFKPGSDLLCVYYEADK